MRNVFSDRGSVINKQLSVINYQLSINSDWGLVMGGEPKTKANLPSAGRDEDEDLVHWFEKKRDVISSDR